MNTVAGETAYPTARIALLWSGRPAYLPAPKLSENQITIYAKARLDSPFPVLAGTEQPLADSQTYDVRKVLEQVVDVDSLDMVCVHTGGSGIHQPVNLGSLHCPKVLIAGDTHHLSRHPISVVRQYARDQGFDALISLFNRDHLKWLRYSPTLRTGWFPGLSIEAAPFPFQEIRQPVMTFIGNIRGKHPRRQMIVDKLTRDGISFQHLQRTRQASATYYANSAVSLNVSLNGDLNMRVFEVLSSGGLLLTDRLSRESGIERLLVEGEDYVAYDSYRDLREKAAYFIASPDRAVEIARNGLDKFRRNLQQSRVAQRFVSWALSRPSDADYADTLSPVAGTSEAARRKLFERLLRTHMFREQTKILAIGRRSTALLKDFHSLPRAIGYRLTTGDSVTMDGVLPCTADELSGHDWALVVVDAEHRKTVRNLNADPNLIAEV